MLRYSVLWFFSPRLQIEADLHRGASVK